VLTLTSDWSCQRRGSRGSSGRYGYWTLPNCSVSGCMQYKSLERERGIDEVPPGLHRRRLRSPNRLLDDPVHLRWSVVGIVAVGITMRVLEYASNRSLTLDESFLALNLLRRGPRGLVRALDWNSGAPFGFLELEKGFIVAFGGGEYVLRALPFVASIIALLLFARLALDVLSPATAFLSIAVFCGFEQVNLYAGITKQYSGDIAVALAIYLMTLHVLAHGYRTRNLIALGALGIIAPVVSHPAVFVLAASGLTLLFSAVAKRDRRGRIAILIVLGTWFATSAGLYANYGEASSRLRQSLAGRSYLGSGDSILDALGSVRVIAGVGSSYNVVWRIDIGDVIASFAGLFLLLGIARLASRRGWVGFLLVSPAVFAAAASTMHVYPLLPRTLLFTAPTLAIGLAEGFAAGATLLRAPPFRWTAALLAGIIFAFSSFGAIRSAVHAVESNDGMRRAMNTLATTQRPTDTVYLSYPAQYPFAYYMECDCAERIVRNAIRAGLWPVRAVPGHTDQWAPALHPNSERFLIARFTGYDLSTYLTQLRSLRGRGRVWIVLTYLHSQDRKRVVSYLDTLGTRVHVYGSGGDTESVDTYLYDMRR
jgi:hypothetical protein